jgi:hypothetical protein
MKADNALKSEVYYIPVYVKTKVNINAGLTN